jgi:phospholipid/cholesterol/gamma-HCH transport system ATP-binding protein
MKHASHRAARDSDGGGVLPGGDGGDGDRDGGDGGAGDPRPSEAGSRPWIAPGEPIISLRGVTKSFGSHTVLEDITFDVPKGRITAILGPSGTGKSVLLKNILGLLVPDRGQIWVDGDQIVGLREKRLYEVRKKFGVLFQDGALFGSMNLYDNIAFPLREHTRKGEAEIREIVYRNAELVGLMAHLKKLPGEVSGGMKKRAGLARAMVTEPEIVLFDEPDSGLDPVRVAYLDELVVTAQKETGATFFIITHNIQSVMRTADYMGILFRSNLVKFASKAEMVASENPVIQQFLAGRPQGPIGMDEMADSDGRAFLEGGDDSIGGDDSLGRGPMTRPGEVARSARAPSDQPVPPR